LLLLSRLLSRLLMLLLSRLLVLLLSRLLMLLLSRLLVLLLSRLLMLLLSRLLMLLLSRLLLVLLSRLLLVLLLARLLMLLPLLLLFLLILLLLFLLILLLLRWLLLFLVACRASVFPGAMLLLRLLLIAPLSCRRFLLGLFEMLAHYLVTRLVMVLLAAQGMLLLYLGIVVSCILTLVDGQRSGSLRGVAIPMVPSGTTLFPGMTPVVTPARRRIGLPATEIDRWLAVIADGNPQDIQRYRGRIHISPRAIVPAARVPVVTLVDPVHAIVKKVVAVDPGRVVDGIARYRNQLRIYGQVDPDAHIG
jgi:hypothetical protein